MGLDIETRYSFPTRKTTDDDMFRDQDRTRRCGCGSYFSGSGVKERRGLRDPPGSIVVLDSTGTSGPMILSSGHNRSPVLQVTYLYTGPCL